MIKNLADWLERRSTGWLVLLTLAIFAGFIALVLPQQAALAQRYTRGVGSPDSSFWYSSADLYHFAEAYGAAGRQAYVRARFTFDVAWPLVYTAFLASAISWLYQRAFPAGSPWRYASLAPLLGLGFDFLENSAAALVMARYPQPTPVVAQLAPVFTLIKWVFVNGSFALLLIGMLVGGWRWVQSRRHR
ncbi:MAG: hypothetical protein H0T53_04855 [Herpetosiphonaceae bacterium]|nr:hypothetical protein [Herpetosiphonaceae bacterium]